MHSPKLNRDNDITDVLDETFTTTEERFGELVTIDLKPNGEEIPVTEENKKDYVDAVVEYRIAKRVREQFDAFMTGFNELVPQDLVMVFDERELELLIGGMSEIDVYVTLLSCRYDYFLLTSMMQRRLVKIHRLPRLRR
jgi:E3 ubiquitin-protein ligase NEDD4